MHVSPQPPTEPELRRIIRLPWLVLYGVGSTVGAGIYVLVGVVAGQTGRLAPFAFLLAALLAVATGLSFAELSKRFPFAGGTLVYVRHGTGSAALSFGVGMLTALAGLVSAATVSVGFVGYFSELIPVPTTLAIPLVVLLVGGIAAWGVQESVVIAGLITVIEVLGLVAVVLFGGREILQHARPEFAPPLRLPRIDDFVPLLASTTLCFFAYLGFEDIVNVGEEVEDADKTLPRAILWTLGLATTLYFCVSGVAVLVVSPSELANSEAPLALVFERSGGSGHVIAGVALVAMLNGALVQIIMASRILMSLSRAGQLPALLAQVHPLTRTPLVATAISALGVGLLGLFFPVETLARSTATIALGVFVLVNASLVLILMRERRADRERPSAVWIGIPILGGLISFAFVVTDLSRRFMAH